MEKYNNIIYKFNISLEKYLNIFIIFYSIHMTYLRVGNF
jgi:hypothetical protein